MLDSLLAIAPLLIAVGAVAGLLAGLFGVGGGLVIVPALYFVMQHLGVSQTTAMAIAVGTSLVSIIPTSLSSLRAHHKLHNVDWAIVRRWSPPLVAGVLLGAALVAHLRSPAFIVFFGVLLLLVALNKLFGQRVIGQLAQMPAYGFQALAAGLIGCVSAIAGVGGGATGVPTLMAFSVPIHRAVGTCAALGLFIALPGAIGVFALSSTPDDAAVGTVHLVYLPALVILGPLTVLCAPLGARLGKRLSPGLLSRLFAFMLILVGLRMVFSALL